MTAYSKTLILIVFLTAFGASAVGGNPEQSPISIKGSNNFTGESINAVREGQSLQLVCVVRNISLGDISWLRDGTQVTYNGIVISRDRRYGIKFDASEKGRRFFRLSIRNISRNDSGNFTCFSLVQGINSSVDIRVRFAPSSEYPKCNREVSSANTNAVDYSCSTERGVPPYTTKWFLNGILQNASHGVSTEDDNTIFTSTIRTALNESIYPFLECRLYLRSREVIRRRCCIGGGGACNSSAGHTSWATTNLNQDVSMVTEAVEYYSESTTDTTNATITTGVQPNAPSRAPPRQTEELALTTTLTSQTTLNQNTLVATDENFDVTTHDVQSSTMWPNGAGQINEPTTSLVKDNESLENVSNGTTDLPGNKPTTDSIDVTEINNLTTSDLGSSDKGTDINKDQDGVTSGPVADAFRDKSTAVAPSEATTNLNQDASIVTEAVEYYSESATDTTNATITTAVQPNAPSRAPPRQTEELALTTTLTSQTTLNQNTLVATDEKFDETTHGVQSSTMLPTGAGQINEPTTSLVKNNESLENESNSTTDSPGTKPTTDSIDVTESNNLTTSDLGSSDEGTDINIDEDGVTSDGITDSPLTSRIAISTAPTHAEGTERNRGRISSTFDPSDATRSLHDILNSTKSDDLTTYVLGFDDVTTQYITTIQTNRSTGNISNMSELNDTWGNNPTVSSESSLYATMLTLLPALMSACMTF